MQILEFLKEKPKNRLKLKKMKKTNMLLGFFLISTSSLLVKTLALTSHMVPTNVYANEKLLVSEPNLYKLYWNYSETEVVYELMIKQTSGWFFFGFTSNDSLVDGTYRIIFKYRNYL